CRACPARKVAEDGAASGRDQGGRLLRQPKLRLQADLSEMDAYCRTAQAAVWHFRIVLVPLREQCFAQSALPTPACASRIFPRMAMCGAESTLHAFGESETIHRIDRVSSTLSRLGRALR